MDKRIAALLEPPDDSQIYKVKQTVAVPVIREADIVAADPEQALDIVRHGAVDWKIRSVGGIEFPDFDRIRLASNAHARALSKHEVALWRWIAWTLACLWLSEVAQRIVQGVLR